eukprot:6491081-Amphidinium_carterae.1
MLNKPNNHDFTTRLDEGGNAYACGPKKIVEGQPKARSAAKKDKTESSQHRRHRRARSNARLLLALGRAASLVNSHHSTMRRTWWACTSPLCGGWEYAGNKVCRRCGATCPHWSWQSSGQPWRRGQSRRAAKRNEAKQSQPPPADDHPKSTDGSAGDTTQMETTSADKDLTTKVRKLEETLKVLGNDGPATLVESIESELQGLRSQLREAAPLPKRLHGLQQGIERRKDKVTKIAEKQAEAQRELNGLEAQMDSELHQIRKKYMTKRAELSAQLEQWQQQKDSAMEELADMREQQSKLVEPQGSDALQDDLQAFRRVLARLTNTVPDYQQVFSEVQAVSREYLEGQPRRPRTAQHSVPANERSEAEEQQPKRSRSAGAGVWTPTVQATHEDVDMDDTPVPTEEQLARLTANNPAQGQSRGREEDPTAGHQMHTVGRAAEDPPCG